jgi:hypothetical protein
MKSVVLPQVRVEPALRAAVEAVLAEGETLSAFVESAVRRAVEHRLAMRDFDARCDAVLKHYLVSGKAFSSDEVLAELRRRLDERRAQLLGEVDG